jgi:hypothetical protein
MFFLIRYQTGLSNQINEASSFLINQIFYMPNEPQELIANEKKFCEENDFRKNSHGVFVYSSTDGASHINLPFILQDYKEWLIDNKIVKAL